MRKNMSLVVSGVKSNHPLSQIYLLSAYKLSLPCRPCCQSLNSSPYYRFPMLFQRLPGQSVTLTPLAASPRGPLPAFSLPRREVLIPPLPIPKISFFPPHSSLYNSCAGFRLHPGSHTSSGAHPPPTRGRADEDSIKQPPTFPQDVRGKGITSRAIFSARLPTHAGGRGSDPRRASQRSPSARQDTASAPDPGGVDGSQTRLRLRGARPRPDPFSGS